MNAKAMQQLAEKLVNCLDDWDEMPWGRRLTSEIYDRLTGKSDEVPQEVRKESFERIAEDITAVRFNSDLVGASGLLEEAFDWDTSPEGKDFWESVRNLLAMYEEMLLEDD